MKKLVRKNQFQINRTSHFKLKFGTLTNSNMQNAVVMFAFSVLDRKYRFWENLFQEIKIVSLKSKLSV